MSGRWEKWTCTLLRVTAWLASVALTILDLGIVRNVVLDAMTWIAVHRSPEQRAQDLLAGNLFGWKIELVGQIMLLVFACVGIGLAIVIEYTYRQAGDRRTLTRRIAKVMLPQVIVAVIGLLLQAVI